MKISEENKKKAQNIGALFKDGRTRTVIVITGVVIIGMIGLSVLRMGYTADEKLPSAVSLKTGPSVEHEPGISNDVNHTALQQQANLQNFEEAKKSNKTSLPVLTNNASVSGNIDLPQLPTNQAQQQLPTIQFQAEPTTNASPTLPTQYGNSTVDNHTVAQATPEKKVVDENIKKYVDGYLNYWSPKNNLLFQEYRTVNQSEKTFETKKETDTQLTTEVANAQTTNKSSSVGKISYIRAGTVVQGKLITPLNSDAVGPVLAEITQGPLLGARLIGSMSVSKESILVTFSKITKPGWPNVYSISAVGMNQDKSVALATDVNKHYLEKYIGLLGGSFLKGYGDGMQQQGNVSYVTDTGTVVNQTDKLSSSQISKTAQGSVLSQLGQDWTSNSRNNKATIKVEGKDGQEYPLQILFLSNF